MSAIVTEQSGKPYGIMLKNSGGILTADQMEQVAEQLAVEWPEYEVTVEHHPGQVAQDALRHSTRENFPDVAALLDGGDVSGALEAFMTVIASERADADNEHRDQ